MPSSKRARNGDVGEALEKDQEGPSEGVLLGLRLDLLQLHLTSSGRGKEREKCLIPIIKDAQLYKGLYS